MPAPRPVPPQLLTGPFTRTYAERLSVSSTMLEGRRFVRLFPRVWRHIDHRMTAGDWVEAARLASPAGAQVSHQTRIRLLGYDDGPERPFHLTIEGDLHIAIDDIFVHRTVRMPPCDDSGVTPAAAYVQCCEDLRLIDLIKMGDFLLHGDHATRAEIVEIAARDPWRPGAEEVASVVPWLYPRSRSPKESEVRALLVAAGLPRPEVNVDLVVDGVWLGCVDLLYRTWMLVVEYEGRQHAFDVEQFNGDIGRYGGFRRRDVAYVQATQEMLNQPRALVRHVYDELVRRGYDGPPPEFGDQWRALFRRVPSTRRWDSRHDDA
jgi:hypothetical protein